MSEETVEVVRVIYDNWTRGDHDAVFALLDTDIEWFLRAGQAVRQRMFRDRAEALEVAGLSE